MNKRLVRKQSERVLGGVCAGLGDYLGIHPMIIRIFFILWTNIGGQSVIVYLLLWVIIPRDVNEAGVRVEDLGARFRQFGSEITEVAHAPSPQLITYAGVGLIVWGVFELLERMGFPWVLREYTWVLWPLLLILAGAVVLGKTLIRRK